MTESSHGEGECLVTERSTTAQVPVPLLVEWRWRTGARAERDGHEGSGPTSVAAWTAETEVGPSMTSQVISCGSRWTTDSLELEKPEP